MTDEGPSLDLESVLTLYLELNEEYRTDVKESFDPACRPHVPLTEPAIHNLVIIAGQHPSTNADSP